MDKNEILTCALHKFNDDSKARSVSIHLNGKLSDAILRTQDGGRFAVHRIILSISNPFFHAVFLRWNHGNEVTIPGLSMENLKAILLYIYSGQMSTDLGSACDLIVDADQFNVLDLKEDCSKVLIENMDFKNCMDIYRFGQSYFLETLTKSSYGFLMRFFPGITESSEEMMGLGVGDLAAILASDDLNVPDERILWDFIIRWIECSAGRRSRHISLLMRQIRLARLTEEFFMGTVMQHPFVKCNNTCRSVLSEAIKLLCDVRGIEPEGEQVNIELARPRMPHQVIFAIGGWCITSPTTVVETFDIRANRWFEIPEVDPGGPRAYHGCAAIGFKIYLVGGFDGIEYFNSFCSFDVITKEWNELAPLHYKRCYVSVVALNGFVYALGGFSGIHRHNTVEWYDPTTNQWLLSNSMNGVRSDANATTLDGKIYIVGGFDGRECVKSCEVFDPKTGRWTLIAPMSCKRSGVSCVSHNGLIYAIGGFNGLSRLKSSERYDPSTNSWSRIAQMHVCRSNLAVQVLEDKIFAIGGYNGSTTISSVECYDVKKNTWKPVAEMNVARSALNACCITGMPNIKDFVSSQRDNLQSYKQWRSFTVGNTEESIVELLPIRFEPENL